jgi:hypothetical protein
VEQGEATTEIKDHGQPGCSKADTDASPDSVMLVSHEYDKRLVKLGKFEKSPYVNYELQKEFTVSKSVECLYNMVCKHG